MKLQWKKLIPCLLIPLAVGGLAALLTREGMADFACLRQPPLTPPAWLFPVVWTLLYLMMGLASYLALIAPAPPAQTKRALILYAAQLLVNFIWPLVFFGQGAFLAAFFWLLALWGLIFLTIGQFRQLSKPAARLLIPYLLWVSFAGYLNLGVYLLNDAPAFFARLTAYSA